MYAMVLCFGIVLTEVEAIATLKRRSVLNTTASRKLVRRECPVSLEIVDDKH